jgi:hypothetical protein
MKLTLFSIEPWILPSPPPFACLSYQLCHYCCCLNNAISHKNYKTLETEHPGIELVDDDWSGCPFSLKHVVEFSLKKNLKHKTITKKFAFQLQ